MWGGGCDVSNHPRPLRAHNTSRYYWNPPFHVTTSVCLQEMRRYPCVLSVLRDLVECPAPWDPEAGQAAAGAVGPAPAPAPAPAGGMDAEEEAMV